MGSIHNVYGKSILSSHVVAFKQWKQDDVYMFQ